MERWPNNKHIIEGFVCPNYVSIPYIHGWNDNPKLFRKADLDTDDILDSDTDNDLNDDDDSDNDDITTKSIPRPTKYQKEIKELDQMHSYSQRTRHVKQYKTIWG